jgi:hypothetical protein
MGMGMGMGMGWGMCKSMEAGYRFLQYVLYTVRTVDSTYYSTYYSTYLHYVQYVLPPRGQHLLCQSQIVPVDQPKVHLHGLQRGLNTH